MNLVFSPTHCPNAQLPEATDLARRAGFDRIELFRTWTQSSPVHPNWSVRMVRDQLDDAALQLTSLNIRNVTGRKADSDERNLPYNLRQIEWDIHLARALRIKTANIKGGQRTDEALNDLIEGVNTLLERVPDFTLNLGNHRGNRLEGIEDYKAVMPNVDERARVLVDTGHLLSAGLDVLTFVETFAERIGLVHLRDQKGETPVPFGQGDLPFEDVLRVLVDVGYDGHLVVELEHATWDLPVRAAVDARDFVQSLI